MFLLFFSPACCLKLFYNVINDFYDCTLNMKFIIRAFTIIIILLATSVYTDPYPFNYYRSTLDYSGKILTTPPEPH